MEEGCICDCLSGHPRTTTVVLTINYADEELKEIEEGLHPIPI